MDTENIWTAASTLYLLRKRHAIWLAILPAAFPLAAAAHGVAVIHPGSSPDNPLTWKTSAAFFRGEATSAYSDTGLNWDAPAVQIPAVILWDESGKGRRTGPGEANTRPGGISATESRR